MKFHMHKNKMKLHQSRESFHSAALFKFWKLKNELSQKQFILDFEIHIETVLILIELILGLMYILIITH